MIYKYWYHFEGAFSWNLLEKSLATYLEEFGKNRTNTIVKYSLSAISWTFSEKLYTEWQNKYQLSGRISFFSRVRHGAPQKKKVINFVKKFKCKCLWRWKSMMISLNGHNFIWINQKPTQKLNNQSHFFCFEHLFLTLSMLSFIGRLLFSYWFHRIQCAKIREGKPPLDLLKDLSVA